MYRIGVDLGGTNIVAGVVDENNKIVAKGNVSTRSNRDAEKIVEDIKLAIKFSMKYANITIDDVSIIGIGTPGSVDRKAGIIEYANNLNFDHVPIREMLESEFHKTVYLENDANCAALGEAIAGAGNGVDEFVFITLGTGIGAGVVVNGKLVHGCNDAAGEIGHTVINFGGERCTCGRRGCWEAYASASALIRQTREAMCKNYDSVMWDMVEYDLKRVDGTVPFEAMRDNDPTAKSVVNNYIYYLSVGIVNLINTFQPKILCIGGGMCAEGETLLYPVRNFVKNERYSVYAKNQTQICAAVLGNDAGIIGAALLTE